MLRSILGTKIAMTQVFDQDGNLVPVTVVSAGPCVVSALRTKEKNGYTAVQLAYGDIKKEKSLTKPYIGIFKKINIAPKKYLKEFHVDDIAGLEVGNEIKVDIFQAGEYVDVVGISKGKGFAGTVKRHNFRGGPTTHGQSDRLRAPGSIGSQGPQRLFKGMRMAGHLGNEQVTVQKIRVVAIEPEKNMILIEGSVPGVKNGLLVLSKTVKKISIHSQAAVSKNGQKAKKAVAPKSAVGKKASEKK
jgi:large subunit ribosomal protein L3